MPRVRSRSSSITTRPIDGKVWNITGEWQDVPLEVLGGIEALLELEPETETELEPETEFETEPEEAADASADSPLRRRRRRTKES